MERRQECNTGAGGGGVDLPTALAFPAAGGKVMLVGGLLHGFHDIIGIRSFSAVLALGSPEEGKWPEDEALPEPVAFIALALHKLLHCHAVHDRLNQRENRHDNDNNEYNRYRYRVVHKSPFLSEMYFANVVYSLQMLFLFCHSTVKNSIKDLIQIQTYTHVYSSIRKFREYTAIKVCWIAGGRLICNNPPYFSGIYSIPSPMDGGWKAVLL